MGNTTKKSTVNIEEPRAMGNVIALDLCENIHLHYRDLRIEFNLKEWEIFSTFIGNMKKWVENHKDYDMTDPKYFNRTGIYIAQKSNFWPGRIQAELQGKPYEGMIHIHYNDLRLEIPLNVFLKIRNMLNDLQV